jgi:hypothetical protein
MTSSNVCALLIVAASGLVGFVLNRWFWGTPFSKTDTVGYGGTPLGGTWLMMSGAVTGLLLTMYVGKYYLASDTEWLITGAGSLVVGLGSAIFAMFWRR